jgi:hypothetical protein
MFAVMWYEGWRVEEVMLGREEGYYAVRSQGGDEAGGDVQSAPGKAGMLCYKYSLLFSPLSVLVSLSFSHSFLSISSSFSSRASDSRIVVRAPTPWSDAMQGRAAPR